MVDGGNAADDNRVPCNNLLDTDDDNEEDDLIPITAAGVGVIDFEIGVIGFSSSFFAEEVLVLLLVALLGECGAMSFFGTACTPIEGTTIDDALSRPFSRGDDAPLMTGLDGPSLASSTIRS